MTDELRIDIREARRLRGLTQEELAMTAGVSLSYLASLERGYRPRTSGPAVDRIAAALVSGDGLSPASDGQDSTPEKLQTPAARPVR